MPLYQAIVLAVVQGLTEFLPVSSTAHLVLFPWLLHWEDPGLTFDVALHAGTLVAVLLYFWKTWYELLTSAIGLGNTDKEKMLEHRRLFGFLVVGTIPGGIAGYLFERAAEDQFRTPVVIGLAMIVVAMLMWLAERTTSTKPQLHDVSAVDAILVGVAQAFAIIPGVSRSGVTMTAGLFRGFSRETTARFSFLLSTPLIAGAVLKKGMEIRHEGIAPDMRIPFIVGIIVSGLVGYLVIGVLMRYLELRTFKIFVVYRLALGVLVLALGWGLRH
ncbi:MAG TPA: undecaprenyl-diphosphate phosphatase [Terriglobia bacterium]|nr:undecaprenyl-diphosphate phosphatase [Terriglobia bacterium]